MNWRFGVPFCFMLASFITGCQPSASSIKQNASSKSEMKLDFNFPKEVEQLDELDRKLEKVHRTTTKLVKNLPLLDDKQQKSLDNALSDSDQVRMELHKDVNSVAKRILQTLVVSPVDDNYGLDAITFASEVGLKAKRLPLKIKHEALSELVIFTESAIAIMEKRGKDAKPFVQVLSSQLIENYMDLEDFAKAKALASSSLEENTDKKSWDFGNVIHDSNMVLAEIAFKEGNVDEACTKLIAASKSPGSPQLDSFGPSFPIVPKLLAAGKKEAVLEYLNGISMFWEAETVKGWIKTIEASGTPADYDWTGRTKED